MTDNNKLWNPYFAGMALGVVLVFSYLVLGAGLGASGGLARISAWLELSLFSEHVLAGQYFGQWGEAPMDYYLVFMLIGIFAGGFLSAFLAGRFKAGMEKGRRAHWKVRGGFAFAGGVLVGFASRLAQGCTSGQALAGGAMLLTGSFVFLVCLFASGYVLARLFRRQWDD